MAQENDRSLLVVLAKTFEGAAGQARFSRAKRMIHLAREARYRVLLVEESSGGKLEITSRKLARLDLKGFRSAAIRRAGSLANEAEPAAEDSPSRVVALGVLSSPGAISIAEESPV